MTSEVCVLNRYAAVLAADSATTVTHGFGENREERYFKGANKIFQLSDHHPVGMMVFDSADLLRVPWELVVKSFRRQLSDKAFNTLEEYGQEFFSYIRTNLQLFPEDVRQESLASAARSVALEVLVAAKESAADVAGRIAALDQSIQARQADLDAKPYPTGLDQAAFDHGHATIAQAVSQTITDLLAIQQLELPTPTHLDALIRLSIFQIYKDPGDSLGSTGLVFAGYGDSDIFPSMIHYKCNGLALNSLICVEEARTVVDYETPAGINAFAQTSMTDTFTLGVSFDVYSALTNALVPGLRSLAEAVCSAASVDPATITNLDDLIIQGGHAVTQEWMKEARRDHHFPMRRVLAVLPIDELTELAETLIRLQSLKEKVTKPSETVGGPVDVAVITKHEGLVWIRRKHYFESSLNPRYMNRLGT